MKIQYASDLHIDFSQNRKFLSDNPLICNGEILVLAGDIVSFIYMKRHKDFFNFLSDNFKTTYWIPGNHEFYHSDSTKEFEAINEKIKDNVFLVNNTSVIHDNVKLIFSTLWTKINEINRWNMENNVSDFHVIKYKGMVFSVSHFNQLHLESLQFIEQELKNKTTDKTIIATHHVPTFENYPEEYKGSSINEAFAVELGSFILKHSPDAWIYGHSHRNTPEFEIGKTKMLSNQLGYVEDNEHLTFDNGKYLEV